MPSCVWLFTRVALASIRMILTRFGSRRNDATANHPGPDVAGKTGTRSHLGITGSGFGFYVQGPGGTLYSQDVRNPGGAAQALFFAGTGIDSGSWWICLESAPQGVSDQDFDDAILFNETVVGLPVHKASWGELKARFR
jgi:hypothetical protein